MHNFYYYSFFTFEGGVPADSDQANNDGEMDCGVNKHPNMTAGVSLSSPKA